MKNIAIIPARGGSKRIPRKNIKPFMGKPILAYSIEAAIQSGLFDEIMVSTDDEEIASIARKCGAKVPFMRSGETANDYATTADVLMEVLGEYKKKGTAFDYACCLYSTAPFVTENVLQNAYNKMVDHHFDSIFTCVEFSYPIWRGLEFEGEKIKMVWPEYLNSRSQDLKKVYHDAGQFYFFNVAKFLLTKEIWGKNTSSLILSELCVQDLDTETDWKLAEMKYELLSKEGEKNHI